MNSAFIKAIIILPGTALVYVPGLLIWLSDGSKYAMRFPPETMPTWIVGICFAVPGLILMIWTVRLFLTKGGGGSPAPWDPIRNFIVSGPYQYVRNPMLSGVILFLVAEAILLHSLPVFGWAIAFFVINTVYFMYSEEPHLQTRYGDAYADYKRHVPRWLPRFKPCSPHRE